MITRVASVTLDVPDLDASVRFVTEKVGLAVTENDGDTAYLRAADRHHDMILHRSPSGTTALRHLNLEVEGDLDEQVRSAVAAGAVDVGPITHPGVERAHVIEIPGGFGLKLFQGMASAPTPPPAPVARPFRFSHFNIGVPDVAQGMAFFAEGLGLRPSDWLGSKEDPFIGWMHCPVPHASHHGVALLKSDIKLHHIAFDFENITDLAARVDNYVDQTHYLVWGMGRHGTGGSVFAYTEDPSGMMVELDTGMIQIGDDPRWTGPRVWSLDDPRGVDEWGSSIPDAWLTKHVAVLSPRSATGS